jgi:hypothetical protein
MTLSPKTIRVSVALLISFSFIVASYFLSSPLRTSIANATSTQELLKAYAVKDTDSDGLPDWQESLYGTDPKNPHSVDSALTDGEAVAEGKIEPKFKSEEPAPEPIDASDIPGSTPAEGSITDRFARQFFQNFMLSQQAGGLTASEADMQTFVAKAIAELEVNVDVSDTYSMKDVVISGSGAEALSAYAAALSNVFQTKTNDISKDELLYLYDAIVLNDSSALEKVASLAAFYSNLSQAIKNVPAPQELSEAHLRLMNVFAHHANVVRDMAAFEKDPLRTFLGIERYAPSVAALARALGEVYRTYEANGVVLTETDSGYSFYSMIERISEKSISQPQTP